MSLLRYLSHPNVVLDPATPVPQWGLSDLGRSRLGTLLGHDWLSEVGRIISSAETKAIQTAEVLGDTLGLGVEVRANTGETDRSSTGFVPPERHEQLADAYFARPEESVSGWERARDSQRRIHAALVDVLETAGGPTDVVVVGHGGVGTLLYCALAGLDIDRRHDQPGQGHHWAYDLSRGEVVHPWRRYEEA